MQVLAWNNQMLWLLLALGVTLEGLIQSSQLRPDVKTRDWAEGQLVHGWPWPEVL